MAYGMAWIPVSFKVTFVVWNISKIHNSSILEHINFNIFIDKLENTHGL